MTSGTTVTGYRRSRWSDRFGLVAGALACAGLLGFVLLSVSVARHASQPRETITAFDVMPSPASPPPRPSGGEASRPARTAERRPAGSARAPTKPLTPPAPTALPAPRAVVAPAPPIALPQPPPPPPARAVTDPAVRGAYAATLWQRIVARRPAGIHIPGTARVTFRLSSSGALEDVELAAPSGNAALDRLALRTVRRAAPFPAPPAELGDALRFTIAFRFD